MLTVQWLQSEMRGQATAVADLMLLLSAPYTAWVCPVACAAGAALLSLLGVLTALTVPLLIGLRRLSSAGGRLR